METGRVGGGRGSAGWPLLLLALLTLPSGCRQTSVSERACTMIGCSDGITVVVEDPPAVPYSVELALPAGGRSTLRCEAPDGCAGGLFFEGITAPEAVLRVSAGDRAIERTVRPEYRISQPNGPGCPPSCRQARVSVRFGD